ncbi:hypothetical protein JCGZ_00971 [Jatropha curcas]|uniref:CDC48 N-terminal subdomain domain-containing protein n=1 Tax=Jatropha curcas TaxID=180498 RepID=A0A067L584_JATCU|nr:hypothetical protein JCGZ_00971 [Jatropha curcas]
MSEQASSFGSRGKKRDYSTAILDRKTSAIRFIVDEAINDDNSSIQLHPHAFEKLNLFQGDTLLIKGKRRKDKICIAWADETCEVHKIRMNRVIRSNLKVRLGDMISVHGFEVGHGKTVHVLPLDDTLEGITAIFLKLI